MLAASGAVRAVVLSRRQVVAPLGRQVQQQAHDLRARQPVDESVVDLREDGCIAGLEPVDHVELPQRPRPVERAREDARHLLAQLRVGARRGQCELAHVEVEVEVRVVDPVRIVEPERDLDELPLERRQERQPLAQERLQVAARDRAARPRAGVDDPQSANVARLTVCLQREELRVEARELPHAVTAASTGTSSTGIPFKTALPESGSISSSSAKTFEFVPGWAAATRIRIPAPSWPQPCGIETTP